MAPPIRQDLFPRNNLIAQDYLNGISVPKLQEKYGIKHSAIYKVLDKKGIKRRALNEYRPKSAGCEKEIITAYKSGLSAIKTGEKFGVCESTVFYVLRQAGEKIRGPGNFGEKSSNWKGGVSKDHVYTRQRINNRRNQRKKEDPLFRLTASLRARISCFFRRAKFSKENNLTKTKSTVRLLGADKKTVFFHIESQFLAGMTWENYGTHGWHIDHIIPLSSATTLSELESLMHYTNLQPLWAKDNHKKGAKLCH